MTKGQARMHIGEGHERRVQVSLERRGWHVQLWGQGVMSSLVRQALADLDRGRDILLWRWLPDLIATKGDQTYLVEAKSEQRTDTANFSIELNCLIAHRAMGPLGLPIVIVWADGSCNWSESVRIGKLFVPSEGRRVESQGSGTPFALVRKRDQLPLDDIFGPKLPEEQW